MRKKRAREGKSTDEIEHFPAPSAVTVRWRADVSVGEVIESKVKQINWILCFKNQTLDFLFFFFLLFSNGSQMFLVAYRVTQAPGVVLQHPNVKEYIMEALQGSAMLVTMKEIILVELRMT